MTFSLIARCPDSGFFGIAAATAVPAVGKLLTHARGGVGAVATQAKLNPYLGIDGIRLLQQGRSAAEVRDILASQDPRADHRQFAVLDRQGTTASWTGGGCIPWAGAIEDENFSAQGNRLTGRDVLEEVVRCYRESAGKPLDERLMEALEAGDSVGGDRKGERSATIYIVGREEYPLWDIRVDAHPDPFTELRRLHDIFRRQLIPEIRDMPTRANPAGEPAEGDA
ncbi:MAG: DUF1028 domain-containing protein [Pseudomonadota bacterium]|jgi:uncharacterized Ntn-hydrolase superfamily protein|nr:DUF1028 domain-containing protein [Sphingomonas sp.]MDQ3481984.1 DUF1028 domain-containing protein [Pseudomonadota bacterium]